MRWFDSVQEESEAVGSLSGPNVFVLWSSPFSSRIMFEDSSVQMGKQWITFRILFSVWPAIHGISSFDLQVFV